VPWLPTTLLRLSFQLARSGQRQRSQRPWIGRFLVCSLTWRMPQLQLRSPPLRKRVRLQLKMPPAYQELLWLQERALFRVAVKGAQGPILQQNPSTTPQVLGEERRIDFPEPRSLWSTRLRAILNPHAEEPSDLKATFDGVGVGSGSAALTTRTGSWLPSSPQFVPFHRGPGKQSIPLP
jgi:hypothetical protein